MDKNDTSVMIVANTGPLRDGLHALILAMPQVGSVMEMSDIELALGAPRSGNPSLIVLDADLAEGDVRRAVWRLKTRWSQARCVLLANDVRQKQEAEAAGVDAALLKGAPPARITATIARLLAQGSEQRQLVRQGL